MSELPQCPSHPSCKAGKLLWLRWELQDIEQRIAEHGPNHEDIETWTRLKQQCEFDIASLEAQHEQADSRTRSRAAEL